MRLPGFEEKTSQT